METRQRPNKSTMTSGRTCPDATLDDSWNQSNQKVDFIKVDIEGAEMMFMTGAKKRFKD